MQPDQQRVVDELRELDEKRAKLERFFHEPAFYELHLTDQYLLHEQAKVMEHYGNILALRIRLFNVEASR
jgi:hypothetical protein